MKVILYSLVIFFNIPNHSLLITFPTRIIIKSKNFFFLLKTKPSYYSLSNVCFYLNQPIHLEWTVDKTFSHFRTKLFLSHSRLLLKCVSMCFSFFFVNFWSEFSFLLSICLSSGFHFSNTFSLSSFLPASNSYSIYKHSHLSLEFISPINPVCGFKRPFKVFLLLVNVCVAFTERCLSVSFVCANKCFCVFNRSNVCWFFEYV